MYMYNVHTVSHILVGSTRTSITCYNDLFRHMVPSVELLKKLVWLGIVFAELLCDVWTYIAKPLLDGLGHLQGLLGWYAGLSLSQQLLYEVGDVSPGNGDVFDAAANDVTFRLHK